MGALVQWDIGPMRRLWTIRAVMGIMTSHGDSSWSHLSLTSIPVLHAYSHRFTSYLEAVGAVFKAYNRHCQLTRILYESQHLMLNQF